VTRDVAGTAGATGDALLTRLLEARSAAVADVALDGTEILIRSDETGSMQLYRLRVPDGELTQVTFLDEPVAAARYIPGSPDAVLAVDRGGNENYQLWRVDLRGGDPRPLVVEDGDGFVHVALRSGGAVATIDPVSGTILARRALCAAPGPSSRRGGLPVDDLDAEGLARRHRPDQRNQRIRQHRLARQYRPGRRVPRLVPGPARPARPGQEDVPRPGPTRGVDVGCQRP